MFYIFFNFCFELIGKSGHRKKTGRLAEVIIVTKENIVIKDKLSASASAALDLYYVPHFKKMIYPLLVLNGHEAQYDAHKLL